MNLTARLLDVFDRCPRRFAFERDYQHWTISPLGLLYAGVEGSLTHSDPVVGSQTSIEHLAAHVDVISGDLSSISVVRHVQSMAEVIGLALRSKFGLMERVAPTKLGEHEWKSNLFEARGTLYRVILASHMDDDTLRSYAHSWGTIGELAALERPMSLLVVLIGAQRGGRRHSAWAKGYQHPIQKNLRFAPRKKDSGFTENWKTVWRELSNYSADVWLKQMENDDLLGELIVTRKIQFNAEDERMRQAKRHGAVGLSNGNRIGR